MAKSDQILPGLLKPTRVRLADLIEDPKNARKHGRKNLDALKKALQEFGQHSALVVQTPSNVIRKGNGTYRAMIELGWTHAAAVLIEEDDARSIARAISDNRLGELSTWDDAVLAEILANVPSELAPATGFDSKELERLANALGAQVGETPKPGKSKNPPNEPRVGTYTRMVHLFFAPDDHGEFETIVQELATLWGSEALSETVLRAVRVTLEREKATRRDPPAPGAREGDPA